jgi:hypothetical protein
VSGNSSGIFILENNMKETYTREEVRQLVTKAMAFSVHNGNTLLSFVTDCFLEANDLKEK